MQPNQTALVSTRSSKNKKPTWTREDPTRLDLGVSVRRVRETVQGECYMNKTEKKNLYRSSVWRIANLLQRHHISTHPQADRDGSGQKIGGQLSSSDPGCAVKLSDMLEGIEVFAAVAVTSSLSPPCALLTANDAMRVLGWPGYYCQKHNLTLKWNFH